MTPVSPKFSLLYLKSEFFEFLNKGSGHIIEAVEYDKDGNLVLTPGKYDFYYKVDVDKVYIGASSSTAVDNVTVEEVKAVKVIRNGQLYILRDGVMYNAVGQAIK